MEKSKIEKEEKLKIQQLLASTEAEGGGRKKRELEGSASGFWDGCAQSKYKPIPPQSDEASPTPPSTVLNPSTVLLDLDPGSTLRPRPRDPRLEPSLRPQSLRRSDVSSVLDLGSASRPRPSSPRPLSPRPRVSLLYRPCPAALPFSALLCSLFLFPPISKVRVIKVITSTRHDY
ncbi:hypothetical protein CRG98_027944 [Punica granatum]|uniref:Uncharacterized protein n=1 Tax=Punica granatum TaxID=22663 RepID=A0A2I0J5Z4_PUNGR|nr:hypothetical protein CRG98_027944 [Punica granatum]